MKRILYSTILLAGLFLLAMPVPPVTAQVTPTDYGNFTGTGVSNLFANLTTYTVTSDRVELRNARSFAVIPFLAGVAAATNQAVINYQVSADGTNYSTSSGLSSTVSFSNNTNIVAPYTLFNLSTLDGMRFIRIGTITTASTNTVTNIRIQWARFF